LDFDGDGSSFGAEQALGTEAAVADSANSHNLTVPSIDASGHARVSFGIAPAASGTRWVLKRSTDLKSFSEIYRYDGTTDTAAPGITFIRSSSSVTVTDGTSSGSSVFYRFEAQFEP
jgi:hypothetical protein